VFLVDFLDDLHYAVIKYDHIGQKATLMEMPAPNRLVLDQKAKLVSRLTQALGEDGVIHAIEEVRAYECDALTAYRCPPLAVVLPRTTGEVAAAIRICADMGVPIVPRGAGTSLAGGSLPTADSVILGVARMNRVLEVDYPNRFIRVQQPRRHRCRAGRRVLLRARPFQPACLRHRREHRDEFRRRALPEIRRDHQQPDGGEDGHRRGRGGRDRRRASGPGGV
jgi:hypothetical protein